MAASLKGPQKIKLEWYVDRESYNQFVKEASRKGWAAQVVLEKLMQKFSQTGQV